MIKNIDNKIPDITNLATKAYPEGFRVPFVVAWCQLLKTIILKTFNEIFLSLLSVERKTDMLCVIKIFTRNFLLDSVDILVKQSQNPR